MTNGEHIENSALLDLLRPQPTGGLVVTLKEGRDSRDEINVLGNAVGKQVRSLGISEALEMGTLDGEAAIVIQELGVAFVSDQFDVKESAAIRTRLMDQAMVQEVRPEFFMFAIAAFQDTPDSTWGVQAVGANASPFSGEGIRVAVLDTGLDFGHPDFAGRNIVQRSFVVGEPADDGQGHGTHCSGTATGTRSTLNQLRYGVAPATELHIGKVLNNSGSGRERDIVAGIAWAISSGAK